MIRLVVIALIFCAMPYVCCAQDKTTESDPLAQYRKQAEAKWEAEIVKLEKLDQQQADPKDPILFIGSSSMRLWKSLAEDMAPRKVINRGYGGAKFSDLAVYVDRIVNPHEFQALVIFVGNDIIGKEDDKSPEELARLFKFVVGRVRVKHPTAPIFLIAVTPTPSRFKAWPEIRKANTALEEACNADPTLHFIATEKHYLDADGQPIPKYFVKDMLHQNEVGYKVWAELVRKSLGKVLQQADSVK